MAWYDELNPRGFAEAYGYPGPGSVRYGLDQPWGDSPGPQRGAVQGFGPGDYPPTDEMEARQAANEYRPAHRGLARRPEATGYEGAGPQMTPAEELGMPFAQGPGLETGQMPLGPEALGMPDVGGEAMPAQRPSSSWPSWAPPETPEGRALLEQSRQAHLQHQAAAQQAMQNGPQQFAGLRQVQPMPGQSLGQAAGQGGMVGRPAYELSPQQQQRLQQLEQSIAMIGQDQTLDPRRKAQLSAGQEMQARQIDPMGLYRNGRQPMTMADKFVANNVHVFKDLGVALALDSKGQPHWHTIPQPKGKEIDWNKDYDDTFKMLTYKDADGNTVHPSEEDVEYHMGRKAAYHQGQPPPRRGQAAAPTLGRAPSTGLAQQPQAGVEPFGGGMGFQRADVAQQPQSLKQQALTQRQQQALAAAQAKQKKAEADELSRDIHEATLALTRTNPDTHAKIAPDVADVEKMVRDRRQLRQRMQEEASAAGQARRHFFEVKLPAIYERAEEAKDPAAGFAVAQVEHLTRKIADNPAGIMALNPGERWELIQGLKYARKYDPTIPVPDEADKGAVPPAESIFHIER